MSASTHVLRIGAQTWKIYCPTCNTAALTSATYGTEAAATDAATRHDAHRHGQPIRTMYGTLNGVRSSSS